MGISSLLPPSDGVLPVLTTRSSPPSSSPSLNLALDSTRTSLSLVVVVLTPTPSFSSNPFSSSPTPLNPVSLPALPVPHVLKIPPLSLRPGYAPFLL